MIQLEFDIISLVGGLEHQFYFPIYKGNLIIPIDELILFRGVFPQPPTSHDILDYNLVGFDQLRYLTQGFTHSPPDASRVISHVANGDSSVTDVAQRGLARRTDFPHRGLISENQRLISPSFSESG